MRLSGGDGRFGDLSSSAFEVAEVVEYVSVDRGDWDVPTMRKSGLENPGAWVTYEVWPFGLVKRVLVLG